MGEEYDLSTGESQEGSAEDLQNKQIEKEGGHSDYKMPVSSQSDIHYQLPGMYRSWFLDYASYVILERAVPHINDGLKPVQRRILHSMKRIEDGRFNKVANVVGHTMQFHPHGDASIADALVQLGQKNMLIDCQGNWGNILTGDGAAASRYIEARLSKFALDIVFNPKTTFWKLSYDGRNKEPITLPVKFPLLLAQGAEGIAVGLSSKILPHNFNELLDASIAYLKKEEFTLYPDFPTGGYIDVLRYNDGERGGAVKVRAKIRKLDNKTLVIDEIPFGKTTGTLIESILKANEKGKIKIKKIDDNTAEKVEILVHLAPGISSDKTIDALYAFTDCEVSISCNCCVIRNNSPEFLSVSHILKTNTEQTVALLQRELEIRLAELQEELMYCSLEKIFIEERIYKASEFEKSSNMDQALDYIRLRLQPFVKDLIREITREDLLRLMEIKMARILKFNSDKSDQNMLHLKKEIEQVRHNISHIIDYSIDWFLYLKNKYGERFIRSTEIRNFDTIEATKVAEANEKLYLNKEEGFIGTALKKDENVELVGPCSDIDDVIIFYKDGKYKIVKVQEKLFIGKNILHLSVFKKNDKRTVYNVAYRDGKEGFYYIKRFAVTGCIRDREYDLTQGTVGSKVFYFTSNPNGEAEVIRVSLKPAPRLKKLVFEKDFREIAIKSRQSQGNILTKFDVLKIGLKQRGGSTLGGRKVWFDKDILRLNYDQRGDYLGEFHSEDLILIILDNGEYYTSDFDLNNHYETNIYRIEKLNMSKVWTLAYWFEDLQSYYLKRFQFDPSAKKQSLLGGHPLSRMVVLSDQVYPRIEVKFGGNDSFRENEIFEADEFITVKGFAAKGKRISTRTVEAVMQIGPIRFPEETDEPEEREPEVEIVDDTAIDKAIDDITGQLSLFDA